MASAGGHWVKVAQGNIGKMVFVPQGKSASEMITGKAPQGGGFPSSLDGLLVVKGLGGSTGAKLVQDKNGNLYVMKKGASAGHLTEEAAADAAYKAAGVDVPDFKVYQTPSGPVKLSRYLDGKTLQQVENQNPSAYQNALKKLRENFVVDALLGNWDVIGMAKDNVILGNDGKVYRVDNGGALRYRAQGGLKKAWGDNPVEIFTMRKSSQGAPIFGSLKLPDIVSQAEKALGKSSAILAAMPESLKGVVGKRLSALKELVDYYKKLGGGFSDTEIEAEFKSLWAGGG